MSRSYFLLKSEPSVYGYAHLVAEKVGRWDGVRNYQARNFMRSMQVGDLAFFYHTDKAREIVGLVEVVKAAYPDPTAEKGDFSAIDVKPLGLLNRPLPLSEIRTNEKLSEMVLLRNSRLSVQPVTALEFKTILAITKTKI